MELVFGRREMAKAMGMISRAAGKSTVLPVLSSVLISAAQDPLRDVIGSTSNNGHGIYLAATDLETGIRMMVSGRIKQEGAIALPAKKFADIVSALSQDEVTLISTNGKVSIQSENGEFRMVGIPADEFPSLMGKVRQDKQLELTEQPADDKRVEFYSLDSHALGQMLRRTAFAASRDDSRYFLNGVHLSMKSAEDMTVIRMAATDGTRLAVASMIMEQSIDKEIGAIIPNKAVRELEKLTASANPSPKSPGKIKIGIQDDRIVFDAGDTVMVSRLVEGDYPDYQQIIPEGSSINVKADTGRLLAAARRMSQMANPKLPSVRLELEGDRMKVSAENAYFGDGCEEMNVEKDGDDVTIAVNVHYLMDMLMAIDSQETLMGIESEVKPMVIRPAIGDHLCVIMPVRLT